MPYQTDKIAFPEAINLILNSSREIPNHTQLVSIVRDIQKWQKDLPNLRSQGYLDRVQRACSWLDKSIRANDDPEAKFVFIWIALNALCGVREEVYSEDWWKNESGTIPKPRNQQLDDYVPSELEWFLWRMCGLDIPQRTLGSAIEKYRYDCNIIMRTEYLMPNYWDRLSSTKDVFKKQADSDERVIKEATGWGSNREKMYRALCKITVSRLRTLRNQLFHGSATDTHSKRRASGKSELEAGDRLLGELVWAFVKLMATESGRVMYWPPVPYPRAGSPQHRPFDPSWLPPLGDKR